jgi:hypothetical protein
MNDPRPTCPSCGLPADDIEARPHPLTVEQIQEYPRTLRSCLLCYELEKLEV